MSLLPTIREGDEVPIVDEDDDDLLLDPTSDEEQEELTTERPPKVPYTQNLSHLAEPFIIALFLATEGNRIRLLWGYNGGGAAVGLFMGTSEHAQAELWRTSLTLLLALPRVPVLLLCLFSPTPCSRLSTPLSLFVGCAAQEQTSIDYKIKKQLENRRKRGVVDDDIDDDDDDDGEEENKSMQTKKNKKVKTSKIKKKKEEKVQPNDTEEEDGEGEGNGEVDSEPETDQIKERAHKPTKKQKVNSDFSSPRCLVVILTRLLG